MTENVGELQALEARMLQLVKARDAAIDAAEAMIDQANQEFDAIAVELGRAINQARVDSQPVTTTTKKRTRRPRKDPAMDGLTEQEKEMYRQLLAGGKRHSNR